MKAPICAQWKPMPANERICASVNVGCVQLPLAATKVEPARGSSDRMSGNGNELLKSSEQNPWNREALHQKVLHCEHLALSHDVIEE